MSSFWVISSTSFFTYDIVPFSYDGLVLTEKSYDLDLLLTCSYNYFSALILYY